VQEEEEYETKGGRRRMWDDDFVLKRQFSALVPAFDPRPGRTNVQQTTDLDIPPPGTHLRHDRSQWRRGGGGSHIGHEGEKHVKSKCPSFQGGHF
jgi:hypothetical protein